MKQIKIFLLLLAFTFSIHLVAQDESWVAQNEAEYSYPKRLAGSFIDDSTQLTKLFGILTRTEKIMGDSKEAAENFFNKNKKLPFVFIDFNYNVPQNVNLPRIFGKKVKNVAILVGYTNSDAESQIDADKDWFLDPDNFLSTFNPSNNKNIIFTLTFEDGTKDVLTLQTTEDNQILREILKEQPFFEEAFAAIEPALTEKQWEQLRRYDNDVKKFYLNELHPKMIADVKKYLATLKRKDAVIIEIGAGLAKLSKRLFNELVTPDNEIHVFATELMAKNVMLAKKTASEDTPLAEKSKSSIDFINANSVTLLDTLEDSGTLQKINTLQEQYYRQFSSKLPLIVVSSGALNRFVLNDAFQSARVLQNIYRLQPELLLISGLTETLVNEHILKNIGFQTLYRQQGETVGHYYKLRAKSLKDVAADYQRELIKKPHDLDLSLNADPLGTLQNIQAKYLEQVTTIDISHAFFRKQELQEFLRLVKLRCPNIQSILLDYHFPVDEKYFKNSVMQSGMEKLVILRLTKDQRELAFPKSFMDSIFASPVVPAGTTYAASGG